MDRNSFIGLLLIGVILVVYSIYTAPSKEEIEKQKLERDSIEGTVQSEARAVEVNPDTGVDAKADSVIDLHRELGDSIVSIQQKDLFGEFSQSAVREEKVLKIETQDLILTFTNLGGRILSVQLKNYRRFDSTPLFLFSNDDNKFRLNFFTNSNKNIFTDELYFETDQDDKVLSEGDSLELIYKLYSNSGKNSLSLVYRIPYKGFDVGMKVALEGMEELIDMRGDEIALNWEMEIPSQERAIDNQVKASTVYYKYLDESSDYITETKYDKEDLVASVKWVAFKQQYFTAAIVAKESFTKYNASVETRESTKKDHVKLLATNLSIPFGHRNSESFDTWFYFGPNHFQTLESYNVEMESLIPLGWGIFGWVNEWLVIPIFNFLDGFDLNYGLIILLLTIIIKIILFPITYKTYISSAKMKVLKPEISEITKKFKDDAMKKQQATMSLYRQAGVNPLAGCVPMLIQMPILFAMFRFFPASIELRQKSFLWADDLSSYDSIMQLPFNIPFYGSHVSLFTLLMAISMVFYTKINSGQMGLDAGGATSEMQATQMKIMMYLMPVMMLFFFNSYSSGLSYYYFIANVISMGQMLAIKNWIIDEDKIHKQIQLNKAKPQSKKKSRFQRRLEEMAKQRGYQPGKK